MTRDPELDPDFEGGTSLQAQARVNDIERRISALRFRLASLRWLYLPVFFAALVAMIVGLILGAGTPGPMIGGITAIAGGVAVFFPMAGNTRDEITDLEDERVSILAALPQHVKDVPGQIAGEATESEKGTI